MIEDFIFPFDKVEKNSKIILYGGGAIGRNYLNQIKCMNYCNCLFIVDKNYKRIKEIDSVKVCSPEKIKNSCYDKIIIATKDFNDEILSMLYDLKVPEDKIISKVTKCQVDLYEKEIQELKRENKIKSLILESMEEILDSSTKNKKRCPICNNKFWVYFPYVQGEYSRKNVMCPNCNSLERFRAWWLYYMNKTDIFNEKKIIHKVLHFAPERVLYNKFITLSSIDYYPVDYNPHVYGIKDVIDIQKIKYETEMFDIIICNHVLEHIPDDNAAINELYRVLNKGGIAYISVPGFIVSEPLEVTLENIEYNTPELRIKYFGQADHLRRYGWDFVTKLEIAGFKVQIKEINKDFNCEEIICYGLNKNEKLFLCTKT